MSYCHFVQDTSYSYDKEIEKRKTDITQFPLLYCKIKSKHTPRKLGEKSNDYKHCSVLNACIVHGMVTHHCYLIILVKVNYF